jgi:Ca-activated chloride channel family protein
MRWIKYSKFTPEDIEISSEDLLRALSEFLLRSGFDNPYYPNPDRRMTFDELRQAIEQALYEERLFDEEKLEQIREMLNKMSPEALDKLEDRLAQQ